MKKLILTILFICFFLFNALSQTWTQKASMYNYGRRSTFGCSLNGKGYTGLGITENLLQLRDFWAYDTLSNVWTRMTDYPGQGLFENTSFAINGKLYVCLGVDNNSICQNELWEYTPTEDSWLRMADFPGVARYGARAFVIGDSAYVVAGSFGYGDNYLYDMYMYTPINNTWIRKADFPGGNRAFGTAFSVNDNGYFGAGISNSYTPKNDFWKYDPRMNRWFSIQNFPGSPRNAPISFVINNLAFVGFGGNPESTTYYNDFGIYDPSNDTWKQFSVPASIPTRTGCIGFSIGNSGYIGVGLNSTGVLTDLWSFVPELNPEPSNFNSTQNNIAQSPDLLIFPNPTSNFITVKSTIFKSFQLSISDLNGNKVSESQFDGHNTQIDLSKFPPGIYMLNLVGEQFNIVRKIIKD